MAKEQTNFSRAFEELEKIVAAFESGDIDLERDLPKFERGLTLASACRQRLRQIENRIHKIEQSFQEDQGHTTGARAAQEP